MAAFEIHEREREGILIFDVAGRLIVGMSSGSLRDRVEKQCHRRQKQDRAEISRASTISIRRVSVRW